MDMPADQEVLQHGRMFEQFDVLEGARDAKRCHLIRCKPGEFTAFKGDAS